MPPDVVEDLLAGRPLRAVSGAFTVAAACHQMREYGVGALAVLDGTRLIGILSERDVSVRVIAGHRDPMLTLVRGIMTREPRTIPARASVPEALRIMLDGGFRHVPVVQGGTAIGMLSLRDITPEHRAEDHSSRDTLPVLALG